MHVYSITNKYINIDTQTHAQTHIDTHTHFIEFNMEAWLNGVRFAIAKAPGSCMTSGYGSGHLGVVET